MNQDETVVVADLSDPVRAVSVALRESEYIDLQRMADTCQPFSATRMAVMNEAIRVFMKLHESGKVRLTTYCEDGRVKIETSILSA